LDAESAVNGVCREIMITEKTHKNSLVTLATHERNDHNSLMKLTIYEKSYNLILKELYITTSENK
jgi:hypothetical protein